MRDVDRDESLPEASRQGETRAGFVTLRSGPAEDDDVNTVADRFMRALLSEDSQQMSQLLGEARWLRGGPSQLSPADEFTRRFALFEYQKLPPRRAVVRNVPGADPASQRELWLPFERAELYPYFAGRPTLRLARDGDRWVVVGYAED